MQINRGYTVMGHRRRRGAWGRPQGGEGRPRRNEPQPPLGPGASRRGVRGGTSAESPGQINKIRNKT